MVAGWWYRSENRVCGVLEKVLEPVCELAVEVESLGR